jgi:hypothetical protein
MNVLNYLPMWMLFLAVAIPLSLVAWSSRQAARSLAAEPARGPETIYEGPVEYNDDGTRTQSFTVSLPLSQSVTVTHSFGPISISANGREWAANAVLLGLALLCIGLIGLFHFPTDLSPGSGTPGPQITAGEEP